MSSAGAEAETNFAFSSQGLSSLVHNGVQYLRDGRCVATRLLVQNANGSVMSFPLGPVQIRRQGDSVTAAYRWGMVSCSFAGSGDRFDATVSVQNRTQLSIREIVIHLFGLTPPSGGAELPPVIRPKSSKSGLEGPDFITIPYPAATLIIANKQVGKLLGITAQNTGNGLDVAVDSAANAVLLPIEERSREEHEFKARQELVSRQIAPMGSDTYPLTVGFIPAGESPAAFLSGLLARFARQNHPILNWTDRRAIGELVLAGHAKGAPPNPRNPRYWLFLKPSVDVNSEEGRAEFRRVMLKTADDTVANLKKMNAQGVIVWDMEGEEFRPPISYIGDPRHLPPEMQAIADEFMKRFTSAGLRCGMTLRPQRLMTTPSGELYQRNSDDPEDVISNLDEKIGYAQQRWRCTLFYVDSTGDQNWPLPATIFRTLATRHRDILLIPESSTIAYYAASAPYCSSIERCAAPEARWIYERAFSLLSVNLIPVSPQSEQVLFDLTRAGDVLAFPAWYNDRRNTMVFRAYERAGGR